MVAMATHIAILKNYTNKINNIAVATYLRLLNFAPEESISTYLYPIVIYVNLSFEKNAFPPCPMQPNLVLVYSYGFPFNCTTVGQASDPITALT